MATSNTKATCSVCAKTIGSATCNGCQQSFCLKDFLKHREELRQKMDDIGQTFDLLKQEFDEIQTESETLMYIDQWEQNAIKTIQNNAQAARNQLMQIHNEIKQQKTVSIEQFIDEFRVSRDTEDSTEMEINIWIERLKKLRQLLTSTSMTDIHHDDMSTAIKLIKIGMKGGIESIVALNSSSESYDQTIQRMDLEPTERFLDVFGYINLSKDGLQATCSSDCWNGSCVSGLLRYSSGVHNICFRIENKCSRSIFFGIINASQALTRSITNTPSAYGLWDIGHSIANGKLHSKDRQNIIQENDDIILIVDCENQAIELQHERTRRSIRVPVNINQCPFPWKIVTRLDSANDSVRIIY